MRSASINSSVHASSASSSPKTVHINHQTSVIENNKQGFYNSNIIGKINNPDSVDIKNTILDIYFLYIFLQYLRYLYMSNNETTNVDLGEISG